MLCFAESRQIPPQYPLTDGVVMKCKWEELINHSRSMYALVGERLTAGKDDPGSAAECEQKKYDV
jgi:hypothetical protein